MSNIPPVLEPEPGLNIRVDIPRGPILDDGTPDAIASAANPGGSPPAAGDVSNGGILVCHAHFVGSDVPRKIESFLLSSPSFELSVPLGAHAVCLTIALRFRDGWLRHSRVRINFDEFGRTTPRVVTKNLKDEQLRESVRVNTSGGTGSRAYGTVTSTWVGPFSPGPLRDVVVFREWFDVSREKKERLEEIQSECSSWYQDMTPTKGLSNRVHMPHWNNHKDSIPGAFFAFSSRRGETRYGKKDFESAVATARSLVDGTIYKNDRRPLLKTEWLTTALMIFGKSIQYQGDTTVFSSTVVERFSSTARLDGLGDCEDIAKETAMAHADLVELADSSSWKLDFQHGIEAYTIALEASKHECIVTLCTVRRSEETSDIEAHAFALVVPKDFIEGNKGGAYFSFIADGTYPCDPTAPNRPGPRPWKYEHFVSALVYGRGELFFKYRDKNEYGVRADDVFPVIKENVTVEWIYCCKSDDEREWIESILEANLPTTTRTFANEKESIGDRFERLTFVEGKDPKLFPGSFKHMVDHERLRIKKMSNGFQATCVAPDAIPSLMADTERRVETAGYLDPEGHPRGKIIGIHGAVENVRGKKHPYHTHHRPIGKDEFFEHNIPTPDDVAIFIANRVWSHLQDSTKDLVTTSTVWTNKNVYEISDKNEARGLVTMLWFKHKTRSSDPASFDEVFAEAFSEVKRTVERWVKYESRGPTLKKELRGTDNANERKAYLDSFEELGIRVSCMNIKTYENHCGRT